MNLKHELAQFTGTEHYFKWSPVFPNFVLTDGARFLAEQAKAYWLMDLFASYAPDYQKKGFAAMTLTVDGNEGLMVITDGNGNELAKQVVGHTDFPLDKIDLWAEPTCDQDGRPFWIILLPSEH